MDRFGSSVEPARLARRSNFCPEAQELGKLPDASVADWAVPIVRVEAADPEARTVPPGHGDTGGPELLAHTRTITSAAVSETNAL